MTNHQDGSLTDERESPTSSVQNRSSRQSHTFLANPGASGVTPDMTPTLYERRERTCVLLINESGNP